MWRQWRSYVTSPDTLQQSASREAQCKGELYRCDPKQEQVCSAPPTGAAKRGGRRLDGSETEIRVVDFRSIFDYLI